MHLLGKDLCMRKRSLPPVNGLLGDICVVAAVGKGTRLVGVASHVPGISPTKFKRSTGTAHENQ